MIIQKMRHVQGLELFVIRLHLGGKTSAKLKAIFLIAA
jgi:hypothetical protein